MNKTRHEVEAGGVRIAVTECGSGPAVVILHGFTGCAESMAPVAGALAPSFRTLSVDLVGHGASEAPDAPAAYTMDACCAQLEAVVDALEIGAAHWLGYSMGGRVALAFACRNPALVRSLLLVGASAGIADPAERAARRAADEVLAVSIEQQGLEAFVDRWMALPIFASQKRLGDDALAAARRQRLRNREGGLAMSLRGMGSGAQPALHERLAALPMPVCFAAGDEDAKFRAIADELSARVPLGEVALVEESGHAAHLEDPQGFAELASRFFASVPRTVGSTT